jgi:hypothetical protein
LYGRGLVGLGLLAVAREDLVLGERGADRRDDRVARLVAGRARDLEVLLRERRQALEVARGVDDDGRGAARRAHRDGEDRIADHRDVGHHGLPALRASCSIRR